MGRRVVLLSLCLCLAAQKSHDVRILHPKARLVLGGFRGSSVPFQAWVTRHPDNRFVQLEVWDLGVQPPQRIQSSGWTLAPDDPQVQPTWKPLTVHLPHGRFSFRALACTSVTEESECGKVRASASQEVRVCGGAESGC